MKWAKKDDHTRLIYNPHITLAGIPEQAEDFLLGGRTALDWLIDRYQVKTDKKTQITNDPNTYSDDPRYIIDLVKRFGSSLSALRNFTANASHQLRTPLTVMRTQMAIAHRATSKENLTNAMDRLEKALGG